MSLSAADEALLKRYYECKILSLCGRTSGTSELRRPEQAAATSIRLFKRFYATTSIVSCDPRAIMAAAVFLGAKSENAFVRPRALEENLGVDEQALLDAELALLDGTDYELLFKHPYPSARGFVENAARFFASDALTEEADALAEVRRWRCDVNVGGDAARATVCGGSSEFGGDAACCVAARARACVDRLITTDVTARYGATVIALGAVAAAADEHFEASARARELVLERYARTLGGATQDAERQALARDAAACAELARTTPDGADAAFMSEVKQANKRLKKLQKGNESAG